MRVHPEELEFAQLYTSYLHTRNLPFAGLSDEQSRLIVERGRELYRWFRDHQWLHNLISLAVISYLFAADIAFLLWLPGMVGFRHDSPITATYVVASILIGALRGWIMYSIISYSIHEGAAHNLIFRPNGPVTRILAWIGNNMGRVCAADPIHYSEHHRSHHAHFGTEDDGEFLNFVLPRRYWMTLIPLAMFFNFSDFVVHRSLKLTNSRLLSAIATVVYQGALFYFAMRFYGLVFAIIAVATISIHVAFDLDRLRNFVEHNLMPIEQQDGARSLGPGFWGLLMGPGPWGQCCHWMHHLVPSIPWYQQILLHRYVASILTPEQRKLFLLQPIVGFPKLVLRMFIEPQRFVRSLKPGEEHPAPPSAALNYK